MYHWVHTLGTGAVLITCFIGGGTIGDFGYRLGDSKDLQRAVTRERGHAI